MKIHQSPNPNISPKGNFTPALSVYEIKRSITIGEFTVQEFPHVDLTFRPNGLLEVKIMPNDKTHQRYEYSITHTKDCFLMETSPALMVSSSLMKIDMLKDHICLTSTTDPNEILHLTRLKMIKL